MNSLSSSHQFKIKEIYTTKNVNENIIYLPTGTRLKTIYKFSSEKIMNQMTFKWIRGKTLLAGHPKLLPVLESSVNKINKSFIWTSVIHSNIESSFAISIEQGVKMLLDLLEGLISLENSELLPPFLTYSMISYNEKSENYQICQGPPTYKYLIMSSIKAAIKNRINIFASPKSLNLVSSDYGVNSKILDHSKHIAFSIALLVLSKIYPSYFNSKIWSFRNQIQFYPLHLLLEKILNSSTSVPEIAFIDFLKKGPLVYLESNRNNLRESLENLRKIIKIHFFLVHKKNKILELKKDEIRKTPKNQLLKSEEMKNIVKKSNNTVDDYLDLSEKTLKRQSIDDRSVFEVNIKVKVKKSNIKECLLEDDLDMKIKHNGILSINKLENANWNLSEFENNSFKMSFFTKIKKKSISTNPTPISSKQLFLDSMIKSKIYNLNQQKIISKCTRPHTSRNIINKQNKIILTKQSKDKHPKIFFETFTKNSINFI